MAGYLSKRAKLHLEIWNCLSSRFPVFSHPTLGSLYTPKAVGFLSEE